MNKTFLFLAVSLPMIFNSCGDQTDNKEAKQRYIDQLRLQAEDLVKKGDYENAIYAYKTLSTNTEGLSSREYYDLGRCYYYTNSLKESDSIFTLLSEKNKTMTVGYTWRARTRARIDSMNVNFLPKSDFEKIIDLGGSNPERYRSELIEAYLYLGFYHYSKAEFERSREYYNHVIKLNPDSVSLNTAREALKRMDKH